MDTLSVSSSLFAGTPLLPAEVTLIILDELQKTQYIPNLRVVSRQFDALIVPLAYRRVRLTNHIIEPFASKQELYAPSIVQLQVARYLRQHARHFTIDHVLDWSLVANLISSMANLKSVTWDFWDLQPSSLCMSVDSTVGTALYKRWPNVQVHMEGAHALTSQSWDTSNLPDSNTVTCTIAASRRPEYLRIRRLLFDRPRLQKLHLHLVNGEAGRFTPDRVTIETHGYQNVTRLPALKELTIDGYDWIHSLCEGTDLWNWSNITHLELRNVNVTNFFYKVPPQSFSGLKVFIEECSYDSMQGSHRKKTIGLYNLLMQTTALEQLEIGCDTQISDITSIIARNCSHLRTLKLRCFSSHIESWLTPLTVDQLETIDSGCPQLMEMEVDLTLPSSPSASSGSKSTVATTPTSTVMTRSMSKVQEAKRDATNTDRKGLKDRAMGKPAGRNKIPSWYMKAYLIEKFSEPRSACIRRIHGLDAIVRQQGIDFDQANDDFETWKRNRRKEEVVALKKQVDANPAPAFAKFGNLRRLTIFATMKHFVAPESSDQTCTRTRRAVEDWIKELLLTKEGVGFEEVIVHIRSEVVNDEHDVKPEILQSTYWYTGHRNSEGEEIHEGLEYFYDSVNDQFYDALSR